MGRQQHLTRAEWDEVWMVVDTCRRVVFEVIHEVVGGGDVLEDALWTMSINKFYETTHSVGYPEFMEKRETLRRMVKHEHAAFEP